MFWVEATIDVAIVKNIETLWNRTDLEFISDAMNLHDLKRSMYTAVSFTQ